MTAKLSDELQRELQERGDGPLEVIDPGTSRVYVLISREQYDRLKPLFEGEPLSAEEQRELLRRAGVRAGWDDPEMDPYDRYDEHRRPDASAARRSYGIIGWTGHSEIDRRIPLDPELGAE